LSGRALTIRDSLRHSDGPPRTCHVGLVSSGRPAAAEGNRLDIIEAEIRSAQQEVFLEAAKLVLTGDPIDIARKPTSGRT
jgi:hypothetical protein